ncbi:hypothetical protein MMC21_002958 [Puttea exsequens]|nr:hypothetical protein [Puttea exsequens]
MAPVAVARLVSLADNAVKHSLTGFLSTSTPRVRLLPVTQALELFSKKKSIGITKAVFGLLQNDAIVPGFSPVGEYMLYPCLSEIRVSTRPNHAIVPCEFQEKESGETCPSCPRTALRQQEEKAAKYDITFLVGFEIEIVFMSRAKNPNGFSYGEIPVNEGGHSWSNARALQSDALMDMFDAIFSALSASGITLQQFHPESGPGQYEFILPPLPPLQAVDSLLLARETIAHIAANHNLRATLIPKTSPLQPGTGAHTHISLEPAHHWHSFYAGVLKHLRAISAFTYPNDASYERVVDGVWAGSTWVCWGTQNRETPLRRIEGSHFEIKCMDGLANMYLALAAIIGAGLQGVINKQPLEMQDCLADPAQLLPAERVGLGIEQQFPRSIKTALWALEDDIEMKEILGEVVEVYRAVKWEEAKILSEMDDEERRRWLIERY